MTPLKSEYFGAFLAFAKDEEIGLALVVIPGDTEANVPEHPILFTIKIDAARAERNTCEANPKRFWRQSFLSLQRPGR